MGRLRLLSVALSLVLLASTAPIKAAAPGPCPPGACSFVPLYVRTDGPGLSLSSLSGDAMRSDPETFASGHFTAWTPSLAFDLVLAKRDTFLVELASRSPTREVDGHISVRAVALDGSSVLLARHEFEPSAGSMDPARLAAHARETLPMPPLDLIDPVRRLADGGPLATEVLAESYHAFCADQTTISPGCRQLTARYGLPGAFDLCAARPVGNLVGQTVWTAFHAADPVFPPCGVHAFSVANGTAAQADGLVGPTDGVDLSPLDPAPPASWRRVSINATPPAWLPQDATTFRLPPGFQLVLEVALVGVEPTPPGGSTPTPLLLELGRPDALTSLAIRTATPQAFSKLAYHAAPIAPGTHTGFLSTPSDVDDFTFELPPGASATVKAQTSWTHLTLLSPDGAARSGSTLETTGLAGRWVLRVSDPLVDPREYAFELKVVEAAHDPDGGRIGEGIHVGTLGHEDDVDTYVFHADTAQRFALALEMPADARYTLGIPRTGLWDVQRTDDGAVSTVKARAGSTGNVTVHVERVYGSGAYRLSLDLDEGGAFANVPRLEPVHNVSTSALGSLDGVELAGYEGGVEFAWPGRTIRVSPEGMTDILDRGGTGSLARRADGSILRSDALRIVLDRQGTDDPIAPGDRFAFGPRTLFHVGGSPPGLLEVDEDRNERYIPISPSVARLQMHPSGSPIALSYDGRAYRVEGANASRAPLFDGVSAFDAEGRAYRILNQTVVERVDPDGTTATVARSSRALHDIAFGGTRLYGLEGSPANATVAVLDLHVAGFEGFRPAFAVKRAPDLVIAAVEDIMTGVSVRPDSNGLLLPGEDHKIRVHVRNDGESPARATFTDVTLSCASTCQVLSTYYSIRPTSQVQPGETSVIEFDWHSGGRVGQQHFLIRADAFHQVVEASESNNNATLTIAVLVGAPP